MDPNKSKFPRAPSSQQQLLEEAPAATDHPWPPRAKSDFPWVTLTIFIVLTYNSVAAIYRNIGDPWTVSFVAASYLDLALLFSCLNILESTPENSPRRRPLKFAVWALVSLLTAMFSYKVAGVMPWPLAAVVWGMGGLTTAGGFCAIFICRDKR